MSDPGARSRSWYRADLRQLPQAPTGSSFVRNPATADHDALARLLLDAYRGTIDDEGETLEDAQAVVAEFLTGGAIDLSVVAVDQHEVVAAALVYRIDPDTALLAYVVTHPDAQRRGRARQVVRAALEHSRAADLSSCLAAVTDGNLASEQILRGLGFTRTGPA